MSKDIRGTPEERIEQAVSMIDRWLKGDPGNGGMPHNPTDLRALWYTLTYGVPEVSKRFEDVDKPLPILAAEQAVEAAKIISSGGALKDRPTQSYDPQRATAIYSCILGHLQTMELASQEIEARRAQYRAAGLPDSMIK